MIRDVVIEQKREWERRLAERYVERDAAAKFGRAADLIRVIVGPRRAGKSFFALHALGRQGGCGYVNFDDERLVDLRDYEDVIQAVDAVYDRPHTVLLDEIQNLPRWEWFVNRLQRQGRRVVVTGSNSRLLSSELATHLTGRYALTTVLPFSFREVLRAAQEPLTTAERKARLESYAREGGFPEPLLKPLDRADYLRTLAQAVLYKDIVRRYRIRLPGALDELARYLFSNVAKEYSYQTLSKVTRCQSVNTAEKYVRYLEEAFLFFSLRRFSFKVREQATYNKKIYCVDNGLALAMGCRFSEDRGRLYENLVAVELWKRVMDGGAELFFWKSASGEEVDFVVKAERRIQALIQVCVRTDDPRTLARETRALLKAGRELSCGRMVLLRMDEERTERARWGGIEGEIHFVPLSEWLTGSVTGSETR